MGVSQTRPFCIIYWNSFPKYIYRPFFLLCIFTLGSLFIFFFYRGEMRASVTETYESHHLPPGEAAPQLFLEGEHPVTPLHLRPQQERRRHQGLAKTRIAVRVNTKLT